MSFPDDFENLWKRRKPPKPSSLMDASDQELEEHMKKEVYGRFGFTGAIRPGFNFTPREGYRIDTILDGTREMPHLIIAASREKLLPLFYDFLQTFPLEVNALLASRHLHAAHNETTYTAEKSDRITLESTFVDFEEILLNDGCAFLEIYDKKNDRVLTLDDHKILGISQGQIQQKYHRLLHNHGILYDKTLQVVSEAEHVHISSAKLYKSFQLLCQRMGAEEFVSDAENAWSEDDAYPNPDEDTGPTFDYLDQEYDDNES